jgi:hypothetical protein
LIPQLGLTARKFGGGAVIERDSSNGVRRIDRDGKRLEELAVTVLTLAHSRFRASALRHIEGKAARADELAVAELACRGDLYVPDRPIFGGEPCRIAVELLATA